MVRKKVQPDDFSKWFGLHVRRWLQKRGLAQNTLSSGLGFKSASTVTSWIKGRTVPSLRMFHRIADHLELSHREILAVFDLRPR